MARLADEILRGAEVPEWISNSGLPTAAKDVATLERLHDHLRADLMAGIPVLDVSNVADYVWSQKEEWTTTDPDEFPCLTPPFKSFWAEYRRPAIYVHRRDDLSDPESDWNQHPRGKRLSPRSKWVAANTDDWGIERYGCYFDSVDLTVEDPDSLVGILVNRDGSDVLDEWLPSGARWLLRASLYIKQRGERVRGPVAYWLGALDDRGVLMKEAAMGIPGFEHLDAEQAFYWKTILFPTFLPMLRAVCYLHCKNIKAEVHRPPAKLAKKQKRKSGKPTLTFRTLVITPMMQGGSGSRNGGGGGQKSHHFVRGHYADYREKGLFGRATHRGIYWFDLHSRGSREVGEVMGDYEVHAPKEPA